MGQWVMRHGSNGSPFLDACIFLFSVDVKKLLTHSLSQSFFSAGGLILIHDFFDLKNDRVVQYHHVTPLLLPGVV